MSIKLNELKYYLDTGLKCVIDGFENKHFTIKGVEDNQNTPRYGGQVFYSFREEDGYKVTSKHIKPIVRNLSDFKNDKSYSEEFHCITDDSILYVAELIYNDRVLDLSFRIMQWLVDNHYDIFNWVESGKAIDVKTLKIDPYSNE